ncbi:MAG TPA: ComF family protein [Deltaproteobacteria bacterium]|nr:ComF family protein [Deltaproteobacteria bacterium]HPJ93024.1 ComF family protein [Deltaproteobacteria bacterium]HPR50481.1 ComF family protein [Deltaproteobacteria bacterium]
MLARLGAHIFPGRCLVCGAAGHVKLGVCGSCRGQIRHVPGPVCDICGKPIGSPGTCIECVRKRPPFDKVLSAGVFEGLLKDIIHQFKYHNATWFKKPLAGLVFDALAHTDVCPDMITFVPMHWTRMISRGYNQAALIARELSGYMGIYMRYDVIHKKRRTLSQVGLKRSDRMGNLRDVFLSAGVDGKTVLVVDDVITTTRTAREVARSLKKAGASYVLFVSVGRMIR